MITYANSNVAVISIYYLTSIDEIIVIFIIAIVIVIVFIIIILVLPITIIIATQHAIFATVMISPIVIV